MPVKSTVSDQCLGWNPYCDLQGVIRPYRTLVWWHTGTYRLGAVTKFTSFALTPSGISLMKSADLAVSFSWVWSSVNIF